MMPVSGSPVGSLSGMPAVSNTSLAAPETNIALQCRYCSFKKSSARAVAGQRRRGALAISGGDGIEHYRWRDLE